MVDSPGVSDMTLLLKSMSRRPFAEKIALHTCDAVNPLVGYLDPRLLPIPNVSASIEYAVVDQSLRVRCRP